MIVHTDCRHYRGDLPCRPHKKEGVHCETCPHYDAITEKILIIKLGALGDVIRTTPLLRRLKTERPGAQIHWLTHSPEILPQVIDRVYTFTPADIEVLKAMTFDVVYSLDKDREGCALAGVIEAREKYGFHLIGGTAAPINDLARHKWLTGLFDDVNRANTKSYPEEIFEICGMAFQGEEYWMELHQRREWDIPRDQKIIGLNTGCGGRWTTRLWPEAHWTALIQLIQEKGMTPLLLGGPQEDEKNRRLAQATGALYLGHFPLPVFMDLMDQCDLVVTAVTMAMHIALGLQKPLVLFNNIFNRHEFEMYGRGRIVEPPVDCKGCFMTDCDKPCMEKIAPETVAQAVDELL